MLISLFALLLLSPVAFGQCANGVCQMPQAYFVPQQSSAFYAAPQAAQPYQVTAPQAFYAPFYATPAAYSAAPASCGQQLYQPRRRFFRFFR